MRRPGRAACAAAIALLATGTPVHASDALFTDPLYQQHCLVCHGADGHGVPSLGVDLVDSAFVRASSVAGLVTFLKKGRMPGDPGSVAGRPMPGFAWVEEPDLEIIASGLKSVSGGQAPD